MVINVARIFKDRDLLHTLYTTIESVFKDVYIVDLPNTLNSMIFATKSKSDPENLVQNYIQLSLKTETPSLLLSTIENTYLNLQPAPEVNEVIFTDDKAPIEWITNKMILKLFFSEELQNLQ